MKVLGYLSLLPPPPSPMSNLKVVIILIAYAMSDSTQERKRLKIRNTILQKVLTTWGIKPGCLHGLVGAGDVW